MNDVCQKGLEALDAVLAAKASPETDLIAEATRCVARYRDALIDDRCSGDAAAERRLPEVNALLSELVAAEFPLVGVRRKRIEKAHEAYQRLVREAPA